MSRKTAINDENGSLSVSTVSRHWLDASGTPPAGGDRAGAALKPEFSGRVCHLKI
jgi:hypothetical protein